MSNAYKIYDKIAAENLESDKKMVIEYTKLLSFHFRKFKVNCESCVSKTEKEFYPIFHELWVLIHSLPFKLKSDISKNRSLKSLIDNFYNRIKFLPCKICKEHYCLYMKENPLYKITSNEKLQIWTVDLHNNVNSRTGKKKFPFSRAKYKYSI